MDDNQQPNQESPINQNPTSSKTIASAIKNYRPRSRLHATILFFSLAILFGGIYSIYKLSVDAKNQTERANALAKQNSELSSQLAEAIAKQDNINNDIAPSPDASPNAVNPILDQGQAINIQTGGRNDTHIPSDDKSARDRLTISIQNGEIEHCYLEKAEELNSGKATKCTVTGINGKVYKMVERTYGKQAYLMQKILFIMENGDVYAVDGAKWQEEYTAFKVGLEKPVIDIITSGVIRYADGTLGVFAET